MPDQASRLPARASLEQLRKQAKELLRDFRSRSEAAVRRVQAVIPGMSDPARADAITLADVQFVLARELGFETWAELVQHLESTRPPGLAKYERLAEQVARAYMEGNGMAIRELNWTGSTSFVWDHEPERMRRRLPTWYASESRSIDLALADARHLVAKQAGLDGWDELVRSLASAARPVADGGSSRATTPLPFYRIDERERAIEVRGPVSEADWDTVFAVMDDMKLTSLRGAGQITDSALERLARLHHVTSVDISFSTKATRTGLLHLARLPLRSLEVGGWGSQVDDAALELLRHLPELESFSAPWAQRVTDTGIANLASCTRLRSVNLMGTQTGDAALRALAAKPELIHLDTGMRVTPDGLRLLHEVPMFARPLPEPFLSHARTRDPELTHLSLHPRAFIHGGLDALGGLHGICSVRLFGMDGSPPATGAGLLPLGGMEGLVSLWCDPTDDAMAVIGGLRPLRKLMCQDTAAGDDGWVALARSTTIENIWGRRNSGLTGRGFAALRAMPALRALAVTLARVDEPELAALARFPALRDLTPIGLGDRHFGHVGACTDLETLTCMYTDHIGDAAMAHVAGLHRLRKYYAGDTSITDRSLGILAELPALESVELWNCPGITNAGLASLARAPKLREVKLDGLPAVTRDAATLFGPGVTVRITS